MSRIEYSTRYLIHFEHVGGGDAFTIPKHIEADILASLHDRMTQCRYTKPIKSFKLAVKPEAVYEVDIMGQGKTALEKANKDLGKFYQSELF